MRGLRRATIIRLSGLAVALLLSACGSEPSPAPAFAPANYSYLKPLRLNVAQVDIDDGWAPGPDDVGDRSPLRPLDALRRMAQDRLIPSGSVGRAIFHIQDGAIVRAGESLQGRLAVRLDVAAASGAGSGFVEASVSRTAVVPADEEALRQTLYDLTRQMMEDMNVEFEYRVRHSLHDWLEETSPPASAVPAPVERQPLPQHGM